MKIYQFLMVSSLLKIIMNSYHAYESMATIRLVDAM